MKKYGLLLLFCGAMQIGNAQDLATKKLADSTIIRADSALSPMDSTEKATAPSSYLSASIGYLSNSVYNGRKDSLLNPYLTPALGYYHKSGLFINTSLSYLTRAGSSRIDLININAGYLITKGQFDGEISGNKSFYNSSSTNVKSAISGTLTGAAGYDFSILKTRLTAAVNFGMSTDYTLQWEIAHRFELANDTWEITPTITTNASTQNYYGSYYANKRYGSKKKRLAGISYQVYANVEDAAKMKILDFEYSIPIDYYYHQFGFSLAPSYAVAVHPATVIVQLIPSAGPTPKPKIFTETLSNSFFMNFTISYNIESQKKKPPGRTPL